MEEKSGTERIYPAAPLVVPIGQEQQQSLLPPTQSDVGVVTAQPTAAYPPPPPTYDQATGTGAPAGAPTAAGLDGAPTVVLVTQPMATPYGPTAMDILCPFCHNYTRTRLRMKPTMRAHLWALLFCALQLYCCICVPYCMQSCLDTDHYCGMCNHYLGTFAQM